MTRKKNTVSEFNRLIVRKKQKIKRKLFQKDFFLKTLSQLLKALYNINDGKENNILVNTVRSALSDLKDNIETMTETVKRSEELDKTVDIVEKILEFNKQNQDEKRDTTEMPDLES